jgi:hypothetical protein
MKRLKIAGAVIGALLVAALTASAALAVSLPDISVTLTGGTYPIHAQGSLSKVQTSLGSASGVTLKGEGVTLLLLTTELSALGTFNTDFTNVTTPEGKPCNSTGDASKVVLVKGEFHLVPINLSPLTLGILFLVSEFEIECEGGLDLVVRGNVLGSVNGIGSEGTELTGFGGVLEGSKGKNNINEYYNDAGTKIKTALEAEAGAGFTASDENVEGELGLSVLGSQMLVITGR